MNRILVTFIKNDLFQKIALVSIGAAFAQAINLISTPIISRLFDPSAFGILALFTAVTSTIGSISSLRYEIAIPLEKTKIGSKNVILLCLIISAVFCIFLSVATPIAEKINHNYFIEINFDEFKNLIPLYILFSSINLTIAQWTCKIERYTITAIIPIIRTSTVALFQISSGLFHSTNIFLLYGYFAGQVCAVLFSATWAQRNGKIFSAKKRNIPIIIKLIKKYAFLPKLAAPQELLNTLSQNLPNLILPFFFSPQHIGFYWLSIKVLQIPSTIIGNSVRQVLYAKICSLQNQNKPSSYIIIQYSIILFTIGTIMLAPVAIWGAEIFTLAFGRNWAEAGEYSKWIAPWIIMGFSNIPSTCAIQALKLQKKLLCWEIFHFTARTATLLYVPLQYGMEQTVAAYATVGIVFNVILIAMGLYYSNKMLKKEKVEEK